MCRLEAIFKMFGRAIVEVKEHSRLEFDFLTSISRQGTAYVETDNENLRQAEMFK